MNIFNMKIICAILIVVFEFVNCESNFPDSIQRCKFSDTKCLVNTINDLAKSSSGGIPEIGFSSVDPLVIGKATIEQGSSSSPVNIKIRMKDANLIGIKQVIVKKIVGFQSDPKTSKFEIYGFCPSVTILGSYQISGKVLVLPVEGHGLANITLYDNDVSLKLKTHTDIRNNEEYLVVEDVVYDAKSSRMSINMENLFNDALISQSMNEFFNENQAILYQELRPSMNRIFGNILTKRIQAVFNKFPYKKMFLEE